MLIETKQNRLQKAEDAKLLEKAQENNKNDDQKDENTGFVQRLLATIIKNLELTITNVHIRYEDKQTNSSAYPFATGVTMSQLIITTTSSGIEKFVKVSRNLS